MAIPIPDPDPEKSGIIAPLILSSMLPSLRPSLQDYVLRVCASIESLRIPFDANAFRESQKEKDARIETVNGE